jgi:hypothetical protein
MTLRTCVIALLLFPLFAIAAPQKAVSPNIVLTDIRVHGAEKVLKKLLQKGGSWNAVHKGISSGDSEWLDVAAALRPATDAGVSSSLDIALFFALKQAPMKVLTLLVELKIPSNEVCSGGLVLDSDPSKQQINSWFNERIQSVQSVAAANLATIRATCISDLERTKKLVLEGN